MWQNWKPNFPSYSFELTAGDQSSTAYTILKTIFRCQEIVLEKYNTSSSFDAKIKWNGSQLTLLNARVQLKYPENTYKMIKFKNSSGDEVRVSMTAMEIYDGHNNKLDIGDWVFGGSYAVAWGELGGKKNEIILTKPIRDSNEITFNYITELGLEDYNEPEDLYLVNNNKYLDTIIYFCDGNKEKINLPESTINRQIVTRGRTISDVNDHTSSFSYIPGYKITYNNETFNLNGWIDNTSQRNIDNYYWNKNVDYGDFNSDRAEKFNAFEKYAPLVLYNTFNILPESIQPITIEWVNEQLTINDKTYEIDYNDLIILAHRPIKECDLSEIFSSDSFQITIDDDVDTNYSTVPDGYIISTSASVKNTNNIYAFPFNAKNIDYYNITDFIKVNTITFIPATDFSSSYDIIKEDINSALVKYCKTNLEKSTRADIVFDYNQSWSEDFGIITRPVGGWSSSNWNNKINTNASISADNSNWNSSYVENGPLILLYYTSILSDYQTSDNLVPFVQQNVDPNFSTNYNWEVSSPVQNMYSWTSTSKLYIYDYVYYGKKISIPGNPFYFKPSLNSKTFNLSEVKDLTLMGDGNYTLDYTVAQHTVSHNVSISTVSKYACAVILIKNGKLLLKENS